jgi:8-oxo-dGTP pyrophosphatase MutT (NUDIX family)
MSDEPIPAATLIVVRDRAAAAPELLMVERSQGMAFAAGALVFPGGRIDQADRELARSSGLGNDGDARLAAIRETLEETAVPAGLKSPPRPEHCLEIQGALAQDRAFAEVIEQAGLELDPDLLIPFARWVPRFHAVRRFDTMFFLAPVPAGNWPPHVIAGECAGAYWLSASEALERGQRGEARLIFPTRRNLERLALHSTFAEMRADALAHPIEPVTPWIEEHGGEQFITIPDHLGYPVTRERLDGLWRG